MSSFLNTVVAIFGLLIGGYLNLYFHEYVHWAAGKAFSGNPNVLYESWHKIPYPYAVEFKELAQMANWDIRITGILPHILWTTVTVSYIGNPFVVVDTNPIIMANIISENILSTSFLTLIFITASAGAGISVSPSDLVATLRPEDFRENTGRGLSHLDWGHILIGRTS